MNKFFNTDNKVLRIAAKVADILLLQTMWFICSLPLITMGIAASAYYETFRHVIMKNEGTLLRTFWNSLKFNFLRSFLSSLVYELPMLGYIALIIWHYMADSTPEIASMVLIIGLVFFIVIIMMFIMHFFVLRTSGISTGKQFKVAYVLSFKYIFRMLILLLVLLLVLILVEMWVYLFMILPTAYMWLAYKLLEPIAAQYPELIVRTDVTIKL